MHILVWTIENQSYAIDLTAVERVLLAAEITRLPNAPNHVLGALNVHGRVTPVLNMRRILGLGDKELEIQDHFILSHVHGNHVALWVDHVEGIRSCSQEELIPASQVLSHLDAVDYVLKQEGKIILIYDLEKLIPANVNCGG